MKKKRNASALAGIVFFAVMLLAGLAGLIHELWIPQAAENTYQNLKEDYFTYLQQAEAPETAAGSDAAARPAAESMPSDHTEGGGAAIASENPAHDSSADPLPAEHEWLTHMTGWLSCPDTTIDYPVMQGTDNEYYLTHLPDGTYHRNGSLFLDSQTEEDYSGQVTIIYGHNIRTGKMFHDLRFYKEESYMQEHPLFYLTTPQKNYTIRIAGAYLEDAVSFTYPIGFADEEEWNTYMEHVQQRAFYISGELTYGSQLVILSTCSYEFEEARLAVLGVLEEIE